MPAAAQDYALEISEPLFRLTTESIRLRSNETRSHENLWSLTLHLAATDRDMATHDTDVLRQHLKLIPATVDSEFERLVLLELLDLRRTLNGAGWTLSIEKPLFDTLTPLGACRPDFVLEACERNTGEIRRIVVEAMGSHDPDYLASKALTYPRMTQIAPVALVSSADVETGRVGEIVCETLAV